MDTDEVEVRVEDDSGSGVAAAAHRAGEVVADVAASAGSAVADVAASAGSAVRAHGPAVIDASRATAGTAYGQVRQASDQQLILGSTFLVGFLMGLVLARVPRILILLALVPLTVVSGTLLGRRWSMGSTGGRPSED